MAFDLVIRNGLVVDGTGQPRQHADVGIFDGRIVEVGRVSGTSKASIDASDCVVTPGFIDPHTHYDAPICCDGGVVPAPSRPATREVAMRDLVNVEAIPYDLLESGISWDWETFPEYMNAAQ